MKAYSQDLRARVVQAVDKRIGTQREVAEIFGVSRTFVKKLLRLRREAGRFDPKPHRGGHIPRIKGETLELLRQRVTERPDATLEELRRHLAEHSGMRVSAATICRALRKLSLPRKKARQCSGAATGARTPRALRPDANIPPASASRPALGDAPIES